MFARLSDIRLAVVATLIALVFIALTDVALSGIPIVKDNLGALVGIMFLYLPIWFGKSRGEDLEDYGFHKEPVGQGIKVFLGFLCVIIPLFTIGFVVYYTFICGSDGWMQSLAPTGYCRAWSGFDGAKWPTFDFPFLEFALGQLIVIALPEELFFRGFIHKLCENTWPPKTKLWGGGIGLALVVSSALFAVGHLAVGPDPRRLAVFFPGLVFGWMRSKTGSIFAGTMAHFAANVTIYLLQRVFL